MKKHVVLSEVFKMHAGRLYAAAHLGRPFSVLISDADKCNFLLIFKTRAEADQISKVFASQGIDNAVCETQRNPRDRATGYKMYVSTGGGTNTLSCDCD